jgi:hypothetical protein
MSRGFQLSTAALFGLALFAQELPRVDQIIGRNRGTAKAPSLRLQGHIASSNPEESGPFDIWISSPRIAINLNTGDLKMGFDGKQFWRLQSGGPVLTLPGGPITEVVAIFDPARRLRWKELHPKIAVVRRQKLGDRTAFVLETQPGDPDTLRFYIDDQSGDLIRAEVKPGLALDLSDYRNINGWLIPFHIVQTTPEGSDYTYHVIKGDAVDAIDDALFVVPRSENR